MNTWDSAELSMAAYASLDEGLTDSYLSALQDERFTPTQAMNFANRYPRIVTQWNGNPNETMTGFSATIFRDASKEGNIAVAIRGTNELSGDVLPGDADILLSGAAYEQIVAMTNWWLRVVTPAGELVRQYRLDWIPNGSMPPDGVVLRTDGDRSYVLFSTDPAFGTGELGGAFIANPNLKVDVTGHSLGGHLAMAFSTIFSSITRQATAFNAPGFVTNATNSSFFTRLGGWIPQGSDRIVNVIADEALVGTTPHSRIAGLNSRPGVLVNIPIENQWASDEPMPFGALNHSMTTLADSLAVFKLLSDLYPAITTEQYKAILNQATQGTAAGYERIVDALNRLFRNVDEVLPTGNAKREEFYQAIYAISSDRQYELGNVITEPAMTSPDRDDLLYRSGKSNLTSMYSWNCALRRTPSSKILLRTRLEASLRREAY